MSQTREKEDFVFCETYPKLVIITRWIILSIAFGLGIYILTNIEEALGIIYVVYSLVALTLILPLSRCAHCYYHGRVCNTAWGKVAAYLFPKGDESKFVYHYNYAILLHLLWLVPLLASFLQLVRERELLALIVFASYVFVLLMDRVLLKKLACVRCHQREFCPAVPFRKVE